MSAELLREAAKVLKVHASSATSSPRECPWTAYSQPGEVPFDVTVVVEKRYEPEGPDDNGVTRIADLSVESGFRWPAAQAGADARYIALMHPPVALAVADVLDALAVSVASNEFDGRSSVVLVPGYSRACTLARAILRRSE